jgi:solute carrier family 35 protein F5
MMDILRFAEAQMKYGLGLVFIVLVALIWALSSVMVQYMYNAYAFDSPFLLTYIGVSLFTWPLPMKYITNKLIEPCFQSSVDTCRAVVDVADINDACSAYCQMEGYTSTTTGSTAGMNSRSTNVHIHTTNVHTNNVHTNVHTEKQEDIETSFTSNPLNSSILERIPTATATANDTNTNANDSDTNTNTNDTDTDTKKVFKNILPSPPTASSSDTDDDDDDDILNDIPTDGVIRLRSGYGGAPWTRAKHLQAAIKIAPVWFLANWSYNGALFFTSIASSTVLMSTCSLFAFLFAVIVRDEGFHWIKLVGVLLGIVGTGLTGYHDFQDETCLDHCRFALLGDGLAVIAALAFGMYAVQIRMLCPRNEELYSMQSLLGYIGLVNMIVLSPIALWKITGQSHMTFVIFGLIFVRGLFDYVLSEYLYFRAVVLTNATVATLGLTLTIPLAFGADYILDVMNIWSVASVLGAVAVVGGFLLVNFGNSYMSKNNCTDDPYSFDNVLKESLHEAEIIRQQQAQAFMQGHAWPCGCLVDKWIWDDSDILVDDNVLPTMYPSNEQHIVNKTRSFT